METVFAPPRRRGLAFHLVTGLVLAGAGGASFYLAVQQQIGTNFILLQVLALALIAPLPVLIYRGYSLAQAAYLLERDGLRLRWGLRAEDIPLNDIEWVRPASDLGFDLPLPFPRWPGAIRGKRSVAELGIVEFMASETRTMLLVATPSRVYAISPADPNGFIRSFRSVIELGSLERIDSRSAVSGVFLRQVLSDRAVSWMLIGGLALTLLLFVVAGARVAGRTAISLGWTAQGLPMDPVPAVMLFLLPILAALSYAANLLSGLFLYRREDQRPMAYLLFSGGILTPIVLIVATLLMK